MKKAPKKDKFFSKDKVQKRIEEKLEKYRIAVNDENFRKTLDKMPKTQATLDVIEQELESVVTNVRGKTSHEKWFNLMRYRDVNIKETLE
jgi:hypothetical protein